MAVSEGDIGQFIGRHRKCLRFLGAGDERGRGGVRVDAARAALCSAHAGLPAAGRLRCVPFPAMGAAAIGLTGALGPRSTKNKGGSMKIIRSIVVAMAL